MRRSLSRIPTRASLLNATLFLCALSKMRWTVRATAYLAFQQRGYEVDARLAHLAVGLQLGLSFAPK